MEERSSPFTPLEEVLTSQDGSNKRRVRIENQVRHTMLLCGADAPPGTAPRGYLARELSDAIPSEKGKGKGYEGSVTNGKSPSTFTVILFVAGSRSMEARMERRLEGMGRFFGYSTVHIGADL